MSSFEATVRPIKDPESQHPVASAWRPVFHQIVSAFVKGDHLLRSGIDSVDSLDNETARQIAEHIADYGETLIELPDATWQSSISIWMETHWDVIVDLWSAESGCTDMVLHAKVFENGTRYRFEVHLVYVP